MKKVLITGGSGDIAKAIAHELKKNRYDVYAPDRYKLDVTDVDSIQSQIESYCPDVLVNNAGCVIPQDVHNAKLDKTKLQIDINLGGVFLCTEVALKNNPELVVVNIGSAAAVETHSTWSEYCATKAGVVMATKCWSESGVYAVCISPGRTRTKMRLGLYPNEDQDTLLDPVDFSKVILNAIEKKYPSGSHIIVRKQNVQKILNGEWDNELF